VQEAYARALKGFSGFRGDNPRGWLLTIVRNTAYSWIKKHLNEEKLLIPFDEETHAVPVEVVPSELSQGRRQRLGTVMSCLNRARRRLQQELTQVQDREIEEGL
jgi:DNA-directed RNA polymerase specialized sigma24 family protein